MKKKSEQLDWLKNEVIKDEISLKSEKERLIERIKSLKKDDIVKEPIKEKLTLWQRILKVLMN